MRQKRLNFELKIKLNHSTFCCCCVHVAASRMVDHWINNQKAQSGTSSPVRDPQPSPSQSPAPPKKNLKIEAAMSQEKPQPTGGQKTLSERYASYFP